MKSHVLLVDDDSHLRTALSRTLHRHGLQITEASDASAALEELETKTIDVAISDQMMPGTSGTDFLAIVSDRWPATGRIMLTGQADLDVAMHAINRGHVHQFFIKPCQGEVVCQAIHRILKQQELEQASRNLLKVTKRQNLALEELEVTGSGLVSVNRDQHGSIILDADEPDSIDQLIAEMNQLCAKI